ncbi:Txe/YoeB family addiction module toxin [Rickettsia endosymbiont of Oedothorax gibbosus]|uniref:Txe/YoeB family addiction module toxin n=1 Tax=Rickettsia endosymbiont of Oedothorax gibbosus TaxID=931099 RepID=UPI00202554C1|nr:Txe/YoeB family addiction module toxin [Rickettsia endosymbiont of Oedothorax gibbosus]
MTVIYWSNEALEQRQFWKHTDTKIDKRIQKLLDNILLTPYDGIGKPEPLKHKLSGFWSRRIDQKHRLVYFFNEETKIIQIESCKGHYYE